MMKNKVNYFVRLDDACETMDYDKWSDIVGFLIKVGIFPLIGLIPLNKDKSLMLMEEKNYLDLLLSWQNAGCKFALHGYNHLHDSSSKGINPVHSRSEFAGHSLDTQKYRVKNGYNILQQKGLIIDCFFAPSHTFDLNTLRALKYETSIRVISDTIALRAYRKYGFTFMPVQSGSFRKFRIPGDWTFCFHPNTMNEKSIKYFKEFILNNRSYFKPFCVNETFRKKSLIDKILTSMYFFYRKGKKLV